MATPYIGYSPEGNGIQYREFHHSLLSPTPISTGRVYSGKEYCPTGLPAEGNLDGYQTVNRPRTTYTAYDSYQRRSVPFYQNLPNRLTYNPYQNQPSYSLMNQPLQVSRPASGGNGTYTHTAVEAGNTYTRVLGGIEWTDNETRQDSAILGSNNVYSGQQQCQTQYPYSIRATRASYGDLNFVGEKFWRDPYPAGAAASYGLTYR